MSRTQIRFLIDESVYRAPVGRDSYLDKYLYLPTRLEYGES